MNVFIGELYKVKEGESIEYLINPAMEPAKVKYVLVIDVNARFILTTVNNTTAKKAKAIGYSQYLMSFDRACFEEAFEKVEDEDSN